MRKLNRKNRWRVSITNTLIFAILLRRILTVFTHKLALRARTMLQSCRYARKSRKSAYCLFIETRHLFRRFRSLLAYSGIIKRFSLLFLRYTAVSTIFCSASIDSPSKMIFAPSNLSACSLIISINVSNGTYPSIFSCEIE